MTSPSRTPGAPRKPALGFIFITLFLDVLGIGIVVPVLPDLVGSLYQGSKAEAAVVYGLLVALYCLAQFLCAPLLGTLSDQIGRRPVILWALFGAGLDYFLLAWAPSLIWLVAGRIIAGATGANFSAATAYIADISPPEKRAANFGIIGAAFGLGFSIGPALGGIIGEIGPRLPFIVAGCLVMLNCLYGFLILPESLKKENRRKFEFKRANPIASMNGLRRSKLIFGMSTAHFIYNIAHYVFQSVWVLYTGHKLGWSPLDVGISLAVVGIMSAIIQGFVGRKLLPIIGERKALKIGLLIMAAELVGFGMASESWMMYALIVFGSISGIAGPAMQGLISRNIPDDEQGWIQGALTSLSSLAGIFAPPLLTGIFGYFISKNAPIELPGAPFFFSSVLVIVVWIISMKSVKPGEKLTDPIPEKPSESD